MTDRQFFELTPRQFFLMESRQKDRLQHSELLAGIIASTVANFSMAAPETPLNADVFMPSRTTLKKVRQKRADPAMTDSNNRAFFSKFVPELRPQEPNGN